MTKSVLPNIISASRGMAAVTMLFFPISSMGFWIPYCWCGISDMIDGPLARKLNAADELGSRIDGLADLVFLCCASVRILPSIVLPLWIWLWVAAIGIVKVACICLLSSRLHGFSFSHSKMNKLTGLLLFCLPFVWIWIDPVVPTIVVCAVASFSVIF
ncbi:MAG: CDP-alcohol phosphatidyltransferase family protein [Bacteroidales bacterium]|nr:CDP-alcohol phosphatidyltransferase family protein [Bacteroidales bacterium]